MKDMLNYINLTSELGLYFVVALINSLSLVSRYPLVEKMNFKSENNLAQKTTRAKTTQGEIFK